VAAHRRERGPKILDELDRLVDALGLAAGESALVMGVAAAARDDWRAAVWILEHRWPERWAPAGRAAASKRLAEDEFSDWAPDVA
jgi:hypothetical protein